MFSAIRDSLPASRSRGAALRDDALAGLTVGVIALPLSMALSIAVGMPPQHGLYTAIVGGIVIALCGGSKFNVSGPTAAFVVILLPITAQHGPGGLLLAGMLAGLILVAMGALGFGNLIAVVPYPVTVGFTTGIGTVIGLLQLRDLLGLQLETHGPAFLDYLAALGRGLGTARGAEMLTGATTLLTVLGWQRLRSRVPSHLVGLAVGTAMGLLLAAIDPAHAVATIGSRFEWVVDGLRGHGVPPFAPHWVWPWQLADATGQPVGLSIELLKSLIGPAAAIAMLGALESLLCATVADGMTGERHDPNDELIGQGIGNIVVPFLGGIPATAALARTAANIRAGARSPLASVVHALFLLLALIVMAPLLAWLPMASMAALLLVVAWNMSELHHFRRVLRVAPRGDAATLVTCFLLTVLVNMEVAVAVGMGLAALVFIRRTIELTGARIIERHAHEHTADLPPEVIVYDVNGPLFFGAAQKALNGLARLRGEVRVVILDLTDVTMLDMTAIVALESILEDMRERRILVLVCGLAPPMVLRLRRTGLRKRIGLVEFARNMQDAAALARKRL